MTIPIAGLIIGFILGHVFPVSIPMAYTKLFSIALLATLDSALGGLRAAMNNKFDNTVFITGFFLNSLLAAVLVYVGERLGIDLYYVALLVFGLRSFQNLAVLRRRVLKKTDSSKENRLGV